MVIFSSYNGEGPSRFVFVQRHQNSCLLVREASGFSSRLVRAIGTPLDVRWNTHSHFPVATGILGFISIFRRSQASSPFEALNSACLSSCQSDRRPPAMMRRGTRAFSRVSTEDSDIPASREMKDEHAFNHCRELQPYFESGHASLRLETQRLIPVATGILGFLSIFKRNQASSPFEALNSTCLSSCQRDVRPHVDKRWGTRSFSRVCTGHSHIPSFWVMQDEPAFKSLQGNPALLRVRASW